MCDTCGCGPNGHVTIKKPGNEHQHEYKHSHNHSHDGSDHSHEHHHSYQHSHEKGHHDHNHPHEQEHKHHTHEHNDHHHHDHHHSKNIIIEQDVLSKNNLLAERNRGYFEARNIFAINLVSSPGSGKTSLLEKTIMDLKSKHKIFVIEGDQQTMNDANRINNAGAEVVQVNTGNGCHLDSHMINHAVKELQVVDNSLLFIENVGNLVCPSMFDLGENKRVVIISVTEGDDKPAKYPNMFYTSDLCIINKTDLLPYVDFSLEKVKEYALQVNHHLEFIELSVKTGEGMKQWYHWLEKRK